MLLYAWYFACNDVSGCPAPALLQPGTLTWAKLRSQIPWPVEGLRGFASWEVTGWVLVYYLSSLLLYRVLPAHEVLGTKLRESGQPLLYRFNGESDMGEGGRGLVLVMLIQISAFHASVVQLGACATGTYLYGAQWAFWTFITDKYLQILTTNLLLAFSISIAVYVRSFGVKPGNSDLRELAVGGNTGNLIYDFYIGRELNPRITLPLFREIDIKAWLEMRPGLTGWVLLDLAFVAQQYRNYGYLSDSIIFTTAVQTFYVLYGQFAEARLLSMMDIITDGFGYMLAFGDIVWVPFLYSTQCRYLSVYPVHLGWRGLAGVGLIFVLGLQIFRASNRQKNVFRTQPNHPSVKGLSYLQTKRGTRLLTAGWWGVSRHINYFGDWLQASPFSFPTGVAGYIVLPAGGVAARALSRPEEMFTMLDGRQVFQGPARGWGMVFTYLYVLYFAVLLMHRECRDDAACSEKYKEDWERYKKIVKWRILPYIY